MKGKHDSKSNFIRQQGFEEPSRQSCPLQYDALIFQPRIVAVILLAGLLSQSALLFLFLGAILWWCALFPRHNPFDAIYNRTLGARSDAVRLEPAPPPRRFAQALAGTFAMLVAVTLAMNLYAAAYIIETLFAIAVAALSFGRFCLGSFLYHLLRGKVGFAVRTLPWAHRES